MAGRIDTSNRVRDMFGPGKDGFRDGDAVANIDPTYLNALFFNFIQENVVRPAELAGLTPDLRNYDQAIQAWKILNAKHYTRITAGTTWLELKHTGVVEIDAAAGNTIIYLPRADSTGGVPIRYRIIRTDASGNSVKVYPQAGNQVGGGVTGGPVLAGGDVVFTSDGASSWRVGHLARGVQVITSSGSFTSPATNLDVLLIGGGGASGASQYNGRIGGGGAAGATVQAVVPVTFGQSIYTTIGAGGVGNSNNGIAGGNGGTTSFGVFITAAGGGGGGGGTYSGAGGTGIFGTVANGANWHFNARGDDGDDGGASGTAHATGRGGRPYGGGGTRSAAGGVIQALQYGAGGSANYTPPASPGYFAGGNGVAGFASVRW